MKLTKKQKERIEIYIWITIIFIVVLCLTLYVKSFSCLETKGIPFLTCRNY
jgi:hypothetical protein